MKVKLLKKIRKRFDYKFKRNDVYWYDKKYGYSSMCYSVKSTIYYMAEKAIGYRLFNEEFGHKKYEDWLKRKN